MIDIILPAYNGQKFLSEQIESIIQQDFCDWRILARDDDSSDETLRTLRFYSDRLKDKFVIIEDQPGNIGIIGNVDYLLLFATAPYIMFCDQDDLWHPTKISLTLQAMKAAESVNPNGLPILVHSDLLVTDHQFNVINRSFWRYQNLNPHLDSLNRLLLQNTVTGCTVMINRALLNLALPIPAQVIMHDWWLGLVASTFGKIILIDQPTLLYRQHSNNDTGAKQWSTRYVIKKAFTFLDRSTLLESIDRSQRQAEAFLDQFTNLLSAHQRIMIEQFVDLHKLGFLEKRLFLYKHQLLKQGLIRNIGLFSRI